MTMSRPRRFLQQYFYFFMALLVATVVVYGFSQTIDHNLIHPTPLPPFILNLHAIAFSGWVVFFILQSALVRTRKVRIHRTLGWFGVALAVAMLVLGTGTAVSMDRFNVAQMPREADFAAAFLIVQWGYLWVFGVLFALAIYWRRAPEFHRRLMLMATCVLTDAAFGRFPQHMMGFSPFGAVGVTALVLLGVVRDLIVDRRVHKVYLYGIPALLVCEAIFEYTFAHASPWWMHIARAVLY